MVSNSHVENSRRETRVCVCVCVCVCGGGGTWGMGGGLTSYIWHSTDVRGEWSPFQGCQVYD